MAKTIIVLLSAFIALSCGKTQDKVVPVELILNYIGFDCGLKGDKKEIIVPYDIFWTVTVKNNGDKPLMFGAYDHQYDQENRKYGYFEFITDLDTIRMYSRYDLWKIEPGKSFDFRMFILSFISIEEESKELYANIDIEHILEGLEEKEEYNEADIPYEIDSVALKTFYSKILAKNEFVTTRDSLGAQKAIEKLKKCRARYIPMEFEPEEGAYTVNEIMEVRIDTLRVSYTSSGESLLWIEKIGNNWTYKIQ